MHPIKHNFKHKLKHRLLIGVILSTGLFSMHFSMQASALDFGKALEDAAKKKVEELKNGNSITNSESTNTDQSKTSGESQTANDEKTFNWKNPSKAEEIALGREITGSILGAAALIKDDKLQQYVNKVGRWVASQSERADLHWKFGVIESSDLNAFAAPGGYVLITKGLYQQLTNEAQLAGVLGHEIAHIVQKHQLKVLQKQQLVNIGAGLMTDKFGKDNKIAQKAIGSGAEISARSLDKSAEYEADRMGIVLAARAGYDVFGLPEVLQKIGQTNKTDNSVALLFKTHPHPDERLTQLGNSAGSKLDNLKVGKTLEDRFYKLAN